MKAVPRIVVLYYHYFLRAMLDLVAEDLAANVEPEGHGQAVKVPADRSIGINTLRHNANRAPKLGLCVCM